MKCSFKLKVKIIKTKPTRTSKGNYRCLVCPKQVVSPVNKSFNIKYVPELVCPYAIKVPLNPFIAD